MSERAAKMKRSIKRAVSALEMPTTLLMLAGAIILIATALPLFVNMAYYETPAFIRVVSLLPPAFYGFLLVVLYVDPMRSKQWLLVIAGLLSFATALASLIKELSRWSRCNGTSSADVTIVEQDICTNFRGQVWIVPTILIVVFALIVVTGVYLFFVASSINSIFDRSIALAKQEKADGTAKPAAKLTPAYWTGYLQLILNIILTLGLVFVTVVALFSLNASAYYRAAFLMPAAMLMGAYLSMWRTPVRYWIWVLLVFSALTIFGAIWGMVLEFDRYAKCVSTPPTSDTTVEQFICTNEGWLGYIVPWTLLGALVVGIVNFVLLGWRALANCAKN